ncbi:MAG: zinc metallopeptidase [Oscillospiraceae bacterium]|nr:zinc metallopeptidase [Oscillospiraceae bacterium]
MYFDYTYVIFVLPAVILSLWASWNVKRTFRKYSEQMNSRGITGAQAARQVLDANNLRNVSIQRVGAELSDHFDPRSNAIFLSDSVYGSTSTAAVGVACHEVGHAIQHAENYLPIQIRQAILPAAGFGEKLSIPLLIAGLFLSSYSQKFLYLAYAGILLYGMCVLFQVVTLPTEFDASKRALVSIERLGLLEGEELIGAKKVLRAAALTYVAGLATTMMQLLRFIVMVNNRKRD